MGLQEVSLEQPPAGCVPSCTLSELSSPVGIQQGSCQPERADASQAARKIETAWKGSVCPPSPGGGDVTRPEPVPALLRAVRVGLFGTEPALPRVGRALGLWCRSDLVSDTAQRTCAPRGVVACPRIDASRSLGQRGGRSEIVATGWGDRTSRVGEGRGSRIREAGAAVQPPRGEGQGHARSGNRPRAIDAIGVGCAIRGGRGGRLCRCGPASCD